MSSLIAALSLLAIDAPADTAIPRAAAASPAAIPVWWNREVLREIKSPADCAAQSRVWALARDVAGDDFVVEMTMPDGSKVPCRDMAQWSAARGRDGYAATTVDMVLESHFRERELAYSTIPMLEPARQSGFTGVPWRELAPSLIDDDDSCVRGQRLKREKIEWEFEPNRVRYADEQSFAGASVLARGDYDGDGWEDLVVSRSGGYQQGTLRYFDELLFTRRADGRVLDISARLLLGMPTREDLSRHRSALAASFGLPEGVEILLKGTLKSDGRPLEIEMRLTFTDGFASGSYRYGRKGKPIPVEGTLGTRSVLELAEFALGAQPNATFMLDWEVRDGSLQMKGNWCEAIESHEVKLGGMLPKGVGR